jgi:hypothetical protein
VNGPADATVQSLLQIVTFSDRHWLPQSLIAELEGKMASDIGLGAIVRILCTAAVLLAAGCVSGCGSYDVGPDPLPWSPVDEAPQSSGK